MLHKARAAIVHHHPRLLFSISPSSSPSGRSAMNMFTSSFSFLAARKRMPFYYLHLYSAGFYASR